MSWLDALADRVSAIVRGRARDRDLADEIAHHLELETERQLRAGYSPDLARRRAIARFGNPTHISDATRDARGGQTLEGNMQDFRWALRSLRRNAGFTALALTTLALGIGTTTAAYAVFDTVLLRPLPYRNADRLVLIREQTTNKSLLPPSFPNFVDWRSRNRSFDGVASAMFPFAGTVWPAANAEAVRVTVMGVSRGFFSTLGVPLAAGREFTDAEERVGGPHVGMVSYEFWKSSMGGRQPLGDVRWGDTPLAIVGVLPPRFRFVAPADVYFPHERMPGTVRTAHNYLVIGRLARGVTLAAARADMSVLSRALGAQYGIDTQAADANVEPLRDYVVSNYRLVLVVVLGAAAMVLLIACVNLLSAQLARGWVREREVAVRAALGASRGRLARQLCLESTVLVAAGAAIGVALAPVLVALIRRAGAGLVPRLVELSIDARVLAIVVGASVLSVLIAGVYPAVRLSRGGSASLIRGSRSVAGTVRASMWRVLVGFEIALSLVLLVGSTLLVRTVHNILTAPTGIDTHGVAFASFAPRTEDVERLDALSSGLARMPGVTGVAFTSYLPFAWGGQAAPVRRIGDPIDHDWRAFAGLRVITPNYFSVLRQRVRLGRAFSPSDRGGTQPVAVVTPGIAAKLWPGQNPIGQLIATNWFGDSWLTVVGVVDEASTWSMPRGDQNEIYVPIAQQARAINSELVAVVRANGDVRQTAADARARMRELVPQSPAQVGTLDDRVAASAADRSFAMLALVAFAAIAVVLAGVGIYGVVWYIVTTRTREIGIRMALGATGGRVQRELLGSALSMGFGGVCAGVAGAVFATRYLQSSLYGISHFDPSVYVVGASGALLVALAGAYLPAHRSSRVDPMTAIRSAD